MLRALISADITRTSYSAIWKYIIGIASDPFVFCLRAILRKKGINKWVSGNPYYVFLTASPVTRCSWVNKISNKKRNYYCKQLQLVNKPLYSVSLENLKNLDRVSGSKNDKFSAKQPLPSSSGYNYGGGKAQLRRVTLGFYWNPVIT